MLGEVDAFQALADATRRAILKLLRKGSRTAGEIASEFQLTKPTISHHFKVLESAGLVRSERRGTTIVYTLQSNVLEDLAAELWDLSSKFRPGPGGAGDLPSSLRAPRRRAVRSSS